MGDTCERTGYEAVQLSTENDTEYVSSGISDMAGAVAGIDWRTSVYCMDDRTGDYEDGKVNTILGVVSFVVLICCLIYKTNYKRKLITYTDVLHAVLIDNAKHAYVVHLNKDAFLGATGLGAYRVHTVQAQGVSVTHVGQAMGSRDMEQKAIKMIQHKDFLLKRIQEKPVFQEMIENGTFEQVALPVEKILKFKNPGACFVVTYAYKWNGSEYTDTVRFYHSMQDYKELLAYFKERYEAEK